MKSTRPTLTVLAAATSALLLCVSAQAAPIITVNLSTANIALGDVLGVDINVSGLTGALGGFAFDLEYDGMRLSFSNYLADPDTKMGDASNPALDISLGNVGNTVNFNVLAGFFDLADEATLAGIQGAGFTMGRVELAATNLGFASLSVTNFSLSDYAGFTIQDVTAQGARVCVSRDGQGPCVNNVPEPTSALLVGIALGGMAVSRRALRKTA